MSDLAGKRVLVVGLARTGRAVAQCLARRQAVVTVSDLKPPSDFRDVVPELTAQKVGLELGSQRQETLLSQDLIVVSPGVPWDLPHLVAARERGIPVVPEIEVAGWLLGGRLIGITGTNGKTTTTALLGKVLEASGFDTFVCGNIGVPLISAVGRAAPETMVVTELSSFQLEGIQTFHPNVAVLLNITPNHLDRHASFEIYIRAKAQILSNLSAEDFAVLNADDPTVMSLAPVAGKCRRIFFSRRQDLPEGVFLAGGHVRYRVGGLERSLMQVNDVGLRGAFNLENLLAAAAAACVLGADFGALRQAVRDFRGVEHRLEWVIKVREVDFFNDSKATSVDAAAKALSAFEGGVHLILGGKDKGAPFAPLRPLIGSRARAAYLIGAAAPRLREELAGAVELVQSGDLETAVREAFRRAQPGEVILLSPACASFDQFQDFEHRGRVFKEIAQRIAREAEPGAKLAAPPRAMASATGAAPEDEPRAKSELQAKPAGPVYVYEVAAEELAPLEGEETQAAVPGDDWPMVEMRPTEAVEGEPLLFEVREPGASTPRIQEAPGPRVSQRSNGPSVAKATNPAVGKAEARARGGQKRPPGI